MERIIDFISKNNTNQSYIIGIDGLGGSGKTTLAKTLRDRTVSPSCVFHIDDFIHPRKIRYNETVKEWSCYYNLQWRYEYLIEEIILPVKAGRKVEKMIEFYAKTDDTYVTKGINIPEGTCVIIEGVFLQRPELRPYLDSVVFLDVPREERLKRVLKRDTYIGNRNEILDKYERRYFPAEENYMKECSPRTNADLILTDNRP